MAFILVFQLALYRFNPVLRVCSQISEITAVTCKEMTNQPWASLAYDGKSALGQFALR